VHVFSAKGAEFTASLGQRRRFTVSQKASALKARFTSAVISFPSFGRALILTSGTYGNHREIEGVLSALGLPEGFPGALP
jgi:hypothetical protein